MFSVCLFCQAKVWLPIERAMAQQPGYRPPIFVCIPCGGDAFRYAQYVQYEELAAGDHQEEESQEIIKEEQLVTKDIDEHGVIDAKDILEHLRRNNPVSK